MEGVQMHPRDLLKNTCNCLHPSLPNPVLCTHASRSNDYIFSDFRRFQCPTRSVPKLPTRRPWHGRSTGRPQQVWRCKLKAAGYARHPGREAFDLEEEGEALRGWVRNGCFFFWKNSEDGLLTCCHILRFSRLFFVSIEIACGYTTLVGI